MDGCEICVKFIRPHDDFSDASAIATAVIAGEVTNAQQGEIPQKTRKQFASAGDS